MQGPGFPPAYGHIKIGDRAKQPAIHARLLGDLQHQARHLLAEGLGSSQFFRLHLLQLSATGLEIGNRSVRSAAGHALGNQKITRETVFHSDHIAELAQVDDFL